MKKLLILMMVVSMASLASATLQISVDGNPEPVDSEIIVAPSDIITLDIWTDTGLQPFQSADWALVVDYNYGTITGGIANEIPGGFNSIGGAAPDVENGVLPMEPLAGIWGNLANLAFNPVEAGTVLIDGIKFHCEGPGDALVSLYAITSGVEFPGDAVLMDSVLIHQVPEPMTMALLGLGGLFLRRRK